MAVQRETITPREFTGQFDCIQGKPCPQRHPRANGDYGCTLWWEEDITNQLDQSRKLVEGCAGAVFRFTAELIVDKLIDQNSLVKSVTEQVVNRVGIVFANNIDKVFPLEKVRQALLEKQEAS